MTGVFTSSPLHVELPALSAARLAQQSAATVIDLRSPGEFADDHVPGAVNVPLFGDRDRALIGTLYRQTSPVAAFDEAKRIVHARIHELVAAIAAAARWEFVPRDLDDGVTALTRGGLAGLERALECVPVANAPARPVVFHCWRGGLRSRSVTALVRTLGLDRAVVLDGGYRAFRAHVMAELEAFAAPCTYTLRGLTGVGKTLVLRELERIRPRWTLDLEDLAQHRSSILGGIGLAPVTQRHFESRLHARLARGHARVLVVEGESRKVGDSIVPRRVWSAMATATHFELVAPLERRIAVLRADYLAHSGSSAEVARALAFIDERLGLAGAESLAASFERGEIDRVVRTVLERYYDPLYRHGEQGKRYVARFDASDPVRAAHEIAAWLEREHGFATESRATA